MEKMIMTKKRLGTIEETKALLQLSEDKQNINMVSITRIEENVNAKTRLTEIIGILFDATMEADRRFMDNIWTDVDAAEKARIERNALMRVIRRAGLE